MRTFPGVLLLLLLLQPALSEEEGLLLVGPKWRAEMRQGEGCLSFRGEKNAFRLVPVDERGVEANVRFPFRDEGGLRIDPAQGMSGIRLELDVEAGILPGRTLEDVFYFPERFSIGETVWVPSEGWFVGLLRGREGILALTWPEGDQRLCLTPGEREGTSLFVEMELSMDGKPCCLGLLEGEEIWHRQELSPRQLEQDVLLPWKRPFEARWRAQLPVHAETTCPRTFKFQSSRRSPWRPEIGNYVWPVWFEGEKAYVHASKKIPPEQDLVIYPVDDHELSLLGFARRVSWSDRYAEKGEKYGLPPGALDAPNVGFNACWGTFFLRRSLYTQGLQNRWREYLEEHAEYLADRVHMVQARNERYETFMAELRRLLEAWKEKEKEDPEMQRFLSAMIEQLKLTEEGHARKMCLFGGKTSQDHRAKADLHLARLKELLETPGPEVYPECEFLIDRFNRLSWGHDEMTGMRFSMNARAFALAAALESARVPQAMDHAQEIRLRLREALKGGTHW